MKMSLNHKNKCKIFLCVCMYIFDHSQSSYKVRAYLNTLKLAIFHSISKKNVYESDVSCFCFLEMIVNENISFSSTSGYFVWGSICCLAMALFLIATTIVVSLIPVYLSKKDVSLGYKNNNYYLVYELSSSLQVSFNKAIGTQMALVHNGYLNEKQRFLLETTV